MSMPIALSVYMGVELARRTAVDADGMQVVQLRIASWLGWHAPPTLRHKAALIHNGDCGCEAGVFRISHAFFEPFMRQGVEPVFLCDVRGVIKELLSS